jgi:two-component system chemotaxis response regulator CheB
MAIEGRDVAPGYVYISPTGVNLVMERTALHLEEPRTGQLYVPSADTLFESVCESYGRGSIGVILTGMGADGARGLMCMKEAGAATIAQDEETSTVFGMPKAAVEHGAADMVLPIEDMAGAILELVEVREPTQ